MHQSETDAEACARAAGTRAGHADTAVESRVLLGVAMLSRVRRELYFPTASSRLFRWVPVEPAAPPMTQTCAGDGHAPGPDARPTTDPPLAAPPGREAAWLNLAHHGTGRPGPDVCGRRGQPGRATAARTPCGAQLPPAGSTLSGPVKPSPSRPVKPSPSRPALHRPGRRFGARPFCPCRTMTAGLLECDAVRC